MSEIGNRKLIRPDMGEMKKETPGRAVRRKGSPPEQTNAEEFYYLKQMGSKTEMVFVLEDGETLRGRVEWYDRDCVKVHRDDGPNLLLYKRHIKYVHKEGEDRSDE